MTDPPVELVPDIALHVPQGTVTLLFTDIEGSTLLLHQLGQKYAAALTQHRELLRAAFQAHRGYEVDTQGDAFFVVFSRAADAVAAAIDAQRGLQEHAWPEGHMLRVRMALHTGEPTLTCNGSAAAYVGADVHRAARIMAAAHGGQVLLSSATQELVRNDLPTGVSLQDMGEHHLKDLTHTEHLHQLVIGSLLSDFPPLRTLNSQPNNLPLQLTSFIGRERELQQTKQLLSRSRLLTLTGSGGTGKTRLSLQLAADVLDEYSDGVWFVELAPLSDPGMVPQAVVSAVGAREEPGQALLQTLCSSLRSKKLLLLLDNCEHLLAACAQLADMLLHCCAELQILISSREGLGIAGEQTFHVPSLSVPTVRKGTSVEHQQPTAEQLSESEAVRLFIDRAQAVVPSFALTNHNATALAQVCYRLDGIPLALELAAARLKVLSVEQLSSRLEDRFRLLTGGSRTALPRQQTLRATIDWSYDLLSTEEKVLLRRLSVFAGGWSLEAIEAVCSGDPLEEWQVLDLLGHLVDKSLIVHEEQEGNSRYSMLETVRQYARDRLLESGESRSVRTRHCDYFLQMAEAAAQEVRNSNPLPYLARWDAEYGNIRAALDWCRDEDPEQGLRLATALPMYWSIRNYQSEACEYLKSLLELAPNSGDRALRGESLMALGGLAHADYSMARGYLEQALAVWRDLGDQQKMAETRNMLAFAAANQEEYELAYRTLNENLAFYQEIGSEQDTASTLHHLGLVAEFEGDYARAEGFYEHSLALQQHKDRDSIDPWVLHGLGFTSLCRGDYARARALLSQSTRMFQRSKYAMALARSLERFATLAVAEGEMERALRLMAAAERGRELIGSKMASGERRGYDEAVAVARAGLGSAQLVAIWCGGRAMTLEQAIEYALEKEDI